MTHNFAKRLLSILVMVPLLACTKDDPTEAATNASGFTTFQTASLVLGQPDFTSGTLNTHPAADTIAYAYGLFADSNKVYVADLVDHRVLVYDTVPTASGTAPNWAVGQMSLTSATNSSNANQLMSPTGVFVAGTRLLVSDENTNKVLIWNTIPSANTNADIALGHNSVTGVGAGICSSAHLSGPSQVFVTPAGKIIVVDWGNNRVMIWNSISAVTTGANVDIILGDLACATGTTSSTMNGPIGVWSDDTRLVVSDSGNNRVLIWNSFPTANGAAADFVLGQPGMGTATGTTTATGLTGPYGVASDSTQIFVADAGNNRILIWNSFPTANGAAADAVLGQNSMTAHIENDDDQDSVAGAPSNRTIWFPSHIHYENDHLWVSDRSNYRVLRFDR